MKINYLDIIKNAAAITWKNKYLWWFGFFVLLSEGGSFLRFPAQDKNISQQNFADFFAANRDWIVAAIAAGLVIWLVFLILGLIGRGALIKSAGKILEKRPSDFKDGFGEGKKYFGKIFWISFLTGIFVLATMMVLMIPIGFLFYNKSYVAGGILTFLAFLIFIPIVFLTNFIKEYGYIYAVIFDISLKEALENAYILLAKNIGPSIIVTLVFLVLNLTYAFLLLIVLIPVAIVFLIFGLLLYLLLQKIGIIIAASLGGLAVLLVLSLAGSIYKTFSQIIFILFFREISKIEEEEKVPEAVKEISPASATDPVVGN